MVSTSLKLLYFFTAFVLLITSVSRIRAQSGQMGDNYSGFSEAVFNPALGVLSRNYFELNLASTSVSFNNNYLNIHKGDLSISKPFRGEPFFPLYGTDSLPFDSYKSFRLNQGFLNGKFAGTGFLSSLPGSTIGFSVNSVSNASFKDIPTNVANLIYYDQKVPSQFNIPFNNINLNISALTGIEYQLHYSRILKINRQDLFTGGINLTITQAIAGVFFHAEEFNYTLMNDTVMKIHQFSGELGFSIPINYSDSSFTFKGPLFNGSGGDIDIGLIYTRLYDEPILHRYKKSCEIPYREFQYRFGLSFHDIGKVKLKKNTQTHKYHKLYDLTWYKKDSIPYTTIDTLFQRVSDIYLGNSGASLAANSFEIWMPASVHLLADLNLSRNLLLNFRASIPLNLSRIQLHTPSVIALIPRYETEKFSFSIPLSWYQYQKLNIGLGARFRYFSIGTDQLGSWLGLYDYTGVDIYFSFRMFFVKGNCNRIARPKDCRDLRF